MCIRSVRIWPLPVEVSAEILIDRRIGFVEEEKVTVEVFVMLNAGSDVEVVEKFTPVKLAAHAGLDLGSVQQVE